MRPLYKLIESAGRTGALLLVICIVLGGPYDLRAQETFTLESTWLDVGEWAHSYTNAGSTGNNRTGGCWPNLRCLRGRNDGYHNGIRLWFGVRDWEDLQGETWEHKIVYTEGGNLGIDVFPQTFEMVCRYPRPEIFVDGRPTERTRVACDRVDEEMMADRKITLVTNTHLGIEWKKEALAFSQEHHDDYHVYEFTFTNTGNVDGDEEIELPDQTLNDMYFWFDRRAGRTARTQAAAGRGASWGSWDMKDMVRMADLKANFSWAGYNVNFGHDWNMIGAPGIDVSGGDLISGRDTSGQLHDNAFYGFAKVHADRSVTDASDDPEQPVTQFWYGANDANATGAPPDHTNRQYMRLHYEDWFKYGFKSPTHAEKVEPSGDYAHSTVDPQIEGTDGGVRWMQGFGPYTLGPGESVKIVMVEGAYGLGYDGGLVIGKKYKRLWEEGDQWADISFDSDGNGTIDADESMDKNEWVMTQRDSVLKMFRKAIMNYRSGYTIPHEPRAPSAFHVNSDVGGIALEWEYPGSDPPGGFEIYRSANYWEGDPLANYKYRKIAELDGTAREHFDDLDVQRGIQYYYYIQAVGAENSDGTAMTATGKPLRSGRYYTQTYSSATLKRPPGNALSQAVVVPNPYHVAGDPSVGYPGAPRIGFLDIPGNCTIDIYTERGDHLKTITHDDGSGDEFWDLQTKAQQPVVSGLYVAKITDSDSGDTRFVKFVVIR